MAKKPAKTVDTLVLVNNVCDFSWPLARKLEGDADNHRFVKGEHFVVDAMIERKEIRGGKEVKIQVPAMEIINKLFPNQVTEVKDVIAASVVKELEAEIEELREYQADLEKENADLKAEIAKLKKGE